MTIADDVLERVPGTVFNDRDPATHYWVQDGQVLFRQYPIRGADPESFRFYLGSFAKDRRHCYVVNRRLTGGNSATFRALNNTYATDGKSVWALGGKLKECDAESFVVCDDGVYEMGSGVRTPHGFGKDRSRVFYYDFNGTPNWVRNASAASFVSLNDGFFGKDERAVFCGVAELPKANVQQWTKLGNHYSRDDARIYFLNRCIREADYASFEVIPDEVGFPIARDKRNFYQNSQAVSSEDFQKFFAD